MQSFKVQELYRKLEDIKSYCFTQADTFTEKIRSYTDRFMDTDKKEFDQLLAEIKKDVMRKLQNFIESKISVKSVSFESHITNFTESTDNAKEELEEYHNKLEDGSRRLKEKESHRDKLLENVSAIYSRNMILKKVMRIFKNHQKKKQNKRVQNSKMDQLYLHNLKKKSFFPWRTLCYKDGYENFIKRQTEQDIRNIHEQYIDIIQALKQKISETDEGIKIKKAAKGQFAYALSKNLLKTISNLSMEVMSLNQVTIKDKEFDESETLAFMGEVDKVIKEKIQKVNEYKNSLSNGSEKQIIISESSRQVGGTDFGKSKVKSKKISFI